MQIHHTGINQELQTEEGGPDRNTANHRIKKAQVSDIGWALNSVVGGP